MIRSRPAELVLCFCVFLFLLLYLPVSAGIIIIFCICVVVINRRSDWFESARGVPATPNAASPAASLSGRNRKQTRWRVSTGSSTSLNQLHRIVSSATPSPNRPSPSSFSPNLSPFSSGAAGRPSGGAPRLTAGVTNRMAFECINYNSNHPLNKSPRISPKFTSTPTSCMVNAGGCLNMSHAGVDASGAIGGHSAHRHKGPAFGERQLLPESEGRSPYGATSQSRYIGAGIYPVVNLSPIPPAVLTHSPGVRPKNKMHYKLPHSEMLSTAKLRLGREVIPDGVSSGSGQQSDISSSTPRTLRKRPSKDQPIVNDVINKRHRSDLPYLGEPLHGVPSPSMISDGLIPYFDDQMMESASCLFSQRSLVSGPPPARMAPQLPPTAAKCVTFKRHARSAIESSYSSSKRMMIKNVSAIKRKCDESFSAAGSSKRSNISAVSESPLPPSPSPNPMTSSARPLSSPVRCDDVVPSSPSVSYSSSAVGNISASEVSETQPSAMGEKQSSFRSRYVPTVADYIADRKTDEERLKTILSFLSPLRPVDETDGRCNGTASSVAEGSVVTLNPTPFSAISSLPCDVNVTVSSAHPSTSVVTTSSSSSSNGISFGTTVAPTFAAATTNPLLVSPSNQLPTSTNASLTTDSLAGMMTLTLPKAVESVTAVSVGDFTSSDANPILNFPSVSATTVAMDSSKLLDNFTRAAPFTTPSISTSRPATSGVGMPFSFGTTTASTTAELSKPPSFSFGGSIASVSNPITTVNTGGNSSFPQIPAPTIVTAATNPSFAVPNFATAFGQSQPATVVPTTSTGATALFAGSTNATPSTGGSFSTQQQFSSTATTSSALSNPTANSISSFGNASNGGTSIIELPKSLFGSGSLPSATTTPFGQSLATFGSTMTSAGAFANQLGTQQPSTGFNFGGGQQQNSLAVATSVSTTSLITTSSAFVTDLTKSVASSNAFGATTQTTRASFGNASRNVVSTFGGGAAAGNSFGAGGGGATSKPFGAGGAATSNSFGAGGAATSNSFGAGGAATSNSFGAGGATASNSFGAGGATISNSFGAGGATISNSFGAGGATASNSFGAGGATISNSFGTGGATISNSFGAGGGASGGAFGAAFGGMNANRIGGAATSNSFVGSGSFGATSTVASTMAVGPASLGPVASFVGVNSSTFATPTSAASGFGAVNKMSAFGVGGGGSTQTVNGNGGGMPFAFGAATQTPSSGGFNFGGQTTTNGGSGGFQFGGAQPTATGSLSTNTHTVASNSYNNNFVVGVGQSSAPFGATNSQGFAFNPASPPSFNFGSGLAAPTAAASNPSLFSMGSGAAPISRRANRTLTSRSRHR